MQDRSEQLPHSPPGAFLVRVESTLDFFLRYVQIKVVFVDDALAIRCQVFFGKERQTAIREASLTGSRLHKALVRAITSEYLQVALSQEGAGARVWAQRGAVDEREWLCLSSEGPTIHNSSPGCWFCSLLAIGFFGRVEIKFRKIITLFPYFNLSKAFGNDFSAKVHTH